MRPFNTRAFGIRDLKYFCFLLLASALELKKFLLRTYRQTSGLHFRTRAERAARALATRLFVNANIEFWMSMLITHVLPVDALLPFWTCSFFRHKIYVKSREIIAFSS